MMDVSIIYVNYKCGKLTIKSIESVFLFTKNIKYEIIVVDNDSYGDDSNELSLYCQKHNLTLIKSNENLGFGKANNLGAKHAKGKYLFFLNPDTLLINNAIFELFSFAETNQITTCGGNLLSLNKKPIHSYWMVYPSIGAELSTMFSDIPLKFRYRFSHEYNNSSKPKHVGYITGADLFLRKDVFDKIKGFDEDFFMYFEETEMQYRIKKLGYKIYSVPNAKIVHLESQTIESKEKKIELFYKSRKIYYSKIHTKIYFYISNSIAKFNCCIRILYFFILNNNKKKIYWKTIYRQLLIC